MITMKPTRLTRKGSNDIENGKLLVFKHQPSGGLSESEKVCTFNLSDIFGEKELIKRLEEGWGLGHYIVYLEEENSDFPDLVMKVIIQKKADESNQIQFRTVENNLREILITDEKPWEGETKTLSRN
jgi:hypothetical protein